MGRLWGQLGAWWAQPPPDWGPSDSTPKPAPWQGAQPSQSPPSLLWVKEGWREQVGGRTDVPVPESLTPSREPSAYMKGEQAPPILAGGGTPARGSPRAVPALRARRLGEECQFLPTLASPFLHGTCSRGAAHPLHAAPRPAWSRPPQPRTPGCPQHPLHPCSHVLPVPRSTPHRPSPGTAPVPPPCRGVPGVGLAPLSAWPSCEGAQGPAGLTPR